MDSIKNAENADQKTKAFALDQTSRISITKELEQSYGVFIDIYSKIPLTVGYGEVYIVDSNLYSSDLPICGGLCFAIECYSYKERFHTESQSISLASLGDPYLRLFELPSRDERYNNHYDRKRDKKIDEFISRWWKTKDDFDLFGNEEELSLYICSDTVRERILKIKLFSKRDYYTVAAWFILMETKKARSLEKEADIFETYWPSCQYYHKPLKKEDETKKEKTEDVVFFSDLSTDCILREEICKLPFYRLGLAVFIGYYNENGVPSFFANVNIVNIQYRDGFIRFQVTNSDLKQRIDSIRDFTLAPVLLVEKENEKKIGKTTERIGGIDLASDNAIKEADIIDAPYFHMMPIVLECRLLKREGKYYFDYEASVFKTHISKTVIGNNGEVDMKKAWGSMTYEVIEEQEGEVE